MTPAEIAAVAELAKFGLILYTNYMRQAGLNNEQIDAVYQSAKQEMLIRDPFKIPV